jgi:hypothetical protein
VSSPAPSQGFLFGGDPDCPAAKRHPLRGRGATPQTEFVRELDAPNPAGRRALRFRFRALQSWQQSKIDEATDILLEYFRQLGGVGLVDDELMRVTLTALQEHGRDAILQAIAAKAKSLEPDWTGSAAQKRAKYLGDSVRFFEKLIPTWQDKSAERIEQAAKSELLKDAEQRWSAACSVWSALPPALRDVYYRIALSTERAKMIAANENREHFWRALYERVGLQIPSPVPTAAPWPKIAAAFAVLDSLVHDQRRRYLDQAMNHDAAAQLAANQHQARFQEALQKETA